MVLLSSEELRGLMRRCRGGVGGGRGEERQRAGKEPTVGEATILAPRKQGLASRGSAVYLLDSHYSSR